jgi:hypothetical protein
MMPDKTHRLTLYEPAFYRIRIHGALDESWAEELGMGIGWVKEIGRGPVTILKGEVVDQAALIGLLNRLYGLGLPLVSVEWVSAR